MASRNQLDQLVSTFASGNKAEFARRLGITKQSLNTWYNHEYLDIEKVYFACPGVSAEWLVTGEGEMLTNKRQTAILESDILIPYINEEALRLGKWEESESFILVRGDNHIKKYGFITIMPNWDLTCYIGNGSILGCCIVDANDFKKECLYIIKTISQGTFFVEYLGKETDGGVSVCKFATRRRKPGPEIQLAIPSNDIVKCAEIVDYSVNHYAYNVL